MSTQSYRRRLLRVSQSRPVVKICGNVYFEDSLMVASARPDLMGWIFSPHSKRRVSIETAARQIECIQRESPDIFHVAVCAGNSIPEILRIARAIPGFDFVQIVDGPGVASEMRTHLRKNMEVIPVLRVSSPIVDQDLSIVMPADWVILDAFSPHALGGTGIAFDTSWVQNVSHRYILAGGLTPANVRERLLNSGASGADVSSGVEAETGMRTGPGRKDPQKVVSFIENVKAISFNR